MSAFVNFGGPALTSDSKHTRVENVAMAMVWTPCHYLGASWALMSCLVNPPSTVHGRSSYRSGLPCYPSGADLRSTLRAGVSLVPGPIKRPFKRGLQGERLWDVTVSFYGEILLQGQVKLGKTTKRTINRDRDKAYITRESESFFSVDVFIQKVF